MPEVSTAIVDARGLIIPASLAPRMKIVLSGVATSGKATFLTKPIYAYADAVTGIATVDLVSLHTRAPRGLFYRITFEYMVSDLFGEGAGYVAVEGLEADLYLTEVGGDLADLLLLRPRGDQSWVEPNATQGPPGSEAGDWLFDPISQNFYRVV